ncbi:SEC14-like protein 2 [Orchesella cincta]|uniref:SEC14-like protein 2 n=1 Tax=Orchesella cincta TaxID=48709 RepID=A0A1D2MMX1_ORCCI|nr:SEC14-like protein 2 [Orchesella cincta]
MSIRIVGLDFRLLNILVYFFLSCAGVVYGAENESSNNSSTLTEVQKKALEKFKAQMMPNLEHEYMKDDFFLMRWLKAKDWKVGDAETMLMKNLQWRKQNRMDSIQEENWTDMMREYPYQIDVVDKQHRPVGTLSAKKWDIRRAVSQGRVPRLQRYMYKMLDELNTKLYETRKNGTNVTQWSAIINADGFGLLKHACPSCIPVWVNFGNSASEHYPGFVESISVINVPRPLIRILRPIFATDSLKIFGSDKGAWMKYLDEKIDKDQRRAEFGGTRVN